MTHILLQKVLFREINVQHAPENFYYDHNKGAWIGVNNGMHYTRHESFVDQASKKRDVESGEDQK